MLIRILLYIKHHFTFLWRLVEWINASLFHLLHIKNIHKSIRSVLREYGLTDYQFRLVHSDDLPILEKLIDKQAEGRLDYFNPHKFDLKSLSKVQKDSSFVMMGVFNKSEIIGYFFLRCFWNKKCFVGRLIDEANEGKGIGRVMNDIMYNIAWRSGFRCMSTISKNNSKVMRSHVNNKAMIILKDLANDYMLVEFVKPQNE